MAKRDYYEVLGIDKSSSADEIKKAYRKLAIKFHPDRNQDNPEAEKSFKEATEAYEVLSDEQKKAAYDQYGFAGVDGMGGPSFNSQAFSGFEDIFGDMSSIFGSFFGGGGGGRGRTRTPRGHDLRYDVEISFKDSAFGVEHEIEYERNSGCPQCGGSGAEAGSSKKTCPDCGGAGQVRRSQGFFSVASTCTRCNGEGVTIENPCKNCRGQGIVKKSQKVKVKIPAGISSGKRIRLEGQGDAPARGGINGDLYVYIHVENHQYFERDNYDLYCMVPIAFTQAALGTDIYVRTLDEKKIKLKVAAGTQTGKVLRIRGEGIPILHGGGKRGDMYVKLHVEVPKRLSTKEKSLLKEFSDRYGEKEEPVPLTLKELRRMD